MPNPNAEKELKKFKDDFEKATKKRDRASLESMVHDDFTLVDPDGKIISKQQLIDDIVDPKSTFQDSFNRKEHQTSFHADGDAARETADVTITGNLKGKKVTGQYVNSATYVKGPSGWQMAGNTLTRK